MPSEERTEISLKNAEFVALPANWQDSVVQFTPELPVHPYKLLAITNEEFAAEIQKGMDELRKGGARA